MKLFQRIMIFQKWSLKAKKKRRSVLYQRVSGGKVGQEKERAIEFSKLEVLSAIGAKETREGSVIVNLMQYALFAYLTPLSLYFSTRILPFLILVVYLYFILLILDKALPRPCHSFKFHSSFLLSFLSSNSYGNGEISSHSTTFKLTR